MGLDALLDDRDERPGVKFKDADLIGVPFRIVSRQETGAAAWWNWWSGKPARRRMSPWRMRRGWWRRGCSSPNYRSGRTIATPTIESAHP